MQIGELRKWVSHGLEKYKLSVRRACRVLKLHRSVFRYQPKPKDDDAVRAALLQIAARKPRWGFRKMYQYLRNHGQSWNHKRVHRVYREMGLNLRVKPRKRLPVRTPQPLEAPDAANHSWSLDFMHDSLASGRPIRTLNILDDFNREGLWIEVDTSIPAVRVIRILNMLALWRGLPKQLRIDNGPEFISQQLADWAAEHQAERAFIQPGKPAQNAYIERFNRTYREDVLDACLFETVAEAQAITEDWLEEYNAIRPHEALGGLPPYQFALKMP